LKRGEAGQRDNVALELLAVGEVERLKRGEPSQSGQVATETTATGEVEPIPTIEKGFALALSKMSSMFQNLSDNEIAFQWL
jgi:hypothetical protein